MVTPVSSLCMGGHFCLTSWIATKLSSIRRCKYSDVLEVRTGNSNFWEEVLCRIPQISTGKQILISAQSQDSYAKKRYLSFTQNTVKIKRLQDLLTATQDVSDTVKFQKTQQQSPSWKLMNAWFIEDWILLPSHYPGSLQKCCQSLWCLLETVSIPALFPFVILLTDSAIPALFPFVILLTDSVILHGLQ